MPSKKSSSKKGANKKKVKGNPANASISMTEKAAQMTGLDASFESLVSANLTALTNTTASLSMTVDTIVSKMENMAYYIIALEAVLTELVSAYGIDIAKVNALIRAKIAAGTDNAGDASKALNIAANICIRADKKN